MALSAAHAQGMVPGCSGQSRTAGMCSGSPLKSRTSLLQFGDVGKAQQPFPLPQGCSSQRIAPIHWDSIVPQSCPPPYPAQEHSINPAFPSYPLTRERLPLGSRNAKAQADAAQHCHLQSHPRGHVHGTPLKAETSISMPASQCLYAPTQTYGAPS